MDFHLEFSPKPLSAPIRLQDILLLVGSCFTENIGEKLRSSKFDVVQNPNGILFNPVSVSTALHNYIGNKKVSVHELFYLNEAWHSWEHHSRFSSPDAERAVEMINQSTGEAHIQLRMANVLLITLGSAWVYELTKAASLYQPGKVAANNHKAPASWFCRRLLGVAEVQSLLDQLMQELSGFNSNLKIIFTISPVRHLREGFVENNRSKAALINVVHNIVANYEKAFYFPAYELVIDDLRDYRFYAEDMVHPNYAATNYVWEKFAEVCFDSETRHLMKRLQEINIAKKHKPFNASSNAHQQFLINNFQKVKQLVEEFPGLNFKEELEYFGRG